VGKSGPNAGKHSRNTFASTTFTFGELYNTSISGVAAQAVDFTSMLIDDVATLTVQTILFAENGTIAPTDGERYNVSEGDLKFNVVLSNWLFCTAGDTASACKGAIGEFVDFGIAIKGPRAPDAAGEGEARRSDDAPYILGNGAEFVLSDQVKIDSVWQNMTAGWPKVSSDGSKYIVAIRFPKFNGIAVYDPVVRSAGSASSQTCTIPGECGSSLSQNAKGGIAIAVIVVLLAGAFVVYRFCWIKRGSGAGGAVNNV
jgi:hypothetical protein